MQKHKTLIRRLLIVVISLSVFVGGAIFYVSQLRTTLLSELRTNLMQTAEANARIIEEDIHNEIKTIDSIASMLSNNPSTDAKVLIKDVKDAKENSDFLRFGISGLDGNCYTTDGQKFNIADREYFQSAIQGVSMFSNTFTDVIGKKDINVFASPIYHDGKITNVLFASMETETLSEKLLNETFNDQGFSDVANEEGKIVISSHSKNRKQSIDSITKLNFVDNFDVSQMKNEKTGVEEFITPDKEHRYLAFHRLDINNWYILSIVPSNVVSTQINYFLKMAIVTWLLLAVLFIAIIIYIYISRNKADKKMEELVFYDELTGHYNYNRFRLKVQALLDQGVGNEYTLIEADVRDFKLFNEIYGYQGGDKLLCIIMNACEEQCTKEEACSRISGDRYILLLHTKTEEEIIKRINHIIEAIKYASKGMFSMFNLEYKIGIYMIEESDKDIGKCHDRCAYAKKRIKDTPETFSFFSHEMYEMQLDEKRMESLMESALEASEFEIYLQPKVTLKDKKIHAAEALVRWNSPVYGLIPPYRFIPLFERNGFLEKLDMYMIEEVCRVLENWQKEEKMPIRISVNLSRMYIFKPGFANKIVELVNRHHIEHSMIEFEITENVIYDHSEELRSIIKELQHHGFLIAMDDFGSGYSSLNMLKDIPIDEMKVDQVFFRAEKENKERSFEIIKGVLSMAKSLHIHTVAEGVETEKEVAFLKEAGCDEIQGYYYAKPLCMKDFMEFYHTFQEEDVSL